jgi:hypothetical protein
MADANTVASAAATANADAAASVAGAQNTTASTQASTNATTTANASSLAAAQAAANADNNSNTNGRERVRCVVGCVDGFIVVQRVHEFECEHECGGLRCRRFAGACCCRRCGDGGCHHGGVCCGGCERERGGRIGGWHGYHRVDAGVDECDHHGGRVLGCCGSGSRKREQLGEHERCGHGRCCVQRVGGVSVGGDSNVDVERVDERGVECERGGIGCC